MNPEGRLDTVEVLLDQNLKALSTLQAIVRWCNSGPETPHGEALAAIEQLARGAMPAALLKMPDNRVFPAETIKARAEIERARDHFVEVYAHWDDIELVPDKTIAGAILDVLNWVLGRESFGPEFAEMLKDFDAVAPPRKPS